MRKQTKLFSLSTGLLLIFLMSSLGQIGPAAAANPSTTPLHTNISLNGVDLNAYTDAVNPNAPLISGNNIQLGNLPAGLTFLPNASTSETYTTANVGTATILSDPSLFANLAANPVSNMEFLNNTFNSFTDASGVMVGTDPAVTPTTLTASAYSNGTAFTGSWKSDLANKLSSSDTYSSPGAVSYLPLSNTNFFLLLNLYASGGAASDYVSVVVAMKTNGADFLYTLTLHNTTGTTGYTLTSSGVTFNAYSAFNNYITMAIPVAQSWTDSATSLTIQGIDYTQVLIHTASSSSANEVSLKSHNIAIRSQLPALTNNANSGGYWKYKDATNSLPVNPWRGDDILQTSISGPTSTTYNDNMPLLSVVKASDGNLATLVPFQQIHFGGVMSLLPTTQSDVSSGPNSAGGYLTNEITTYDIRSINPSTNTFYKFADLSTILSVTNWYFNVTLSPSVLESTLSTNYGATYIQNSYTQNSNPTPTAYNSLWSGYTVSTTTVDVRYSISAFSLTAGEIDTFTIGFISQTSYNLQSSIAQGAGGSGSGSTTSNSMSATDIYLIVGAFALVVGIGYIWNKNHKKRK